MFLQNKLSVIDYSKILNESVFSNIEQNDVTLIKVAFCYPFTPSVSLNKHRHFQSFFLLQYFVKTKTNISHDGGIVGLCQERVKN